ncbi:MAG: hypothetical protein L6R40_008029 [Gallowayella cf. fulva]|nr:MAG: hypothetical protein L6R40_008029 [Xanthomendoza cf. fulva]
MQYLTSTLLTLALSATTTLAFPAPSSSNTTISALLEKRISGNPQIGSFDNGFCAGKPVVKYTGHHDWDCFKYTPTTDNVGLNWGTQSRALGITFFTDDNCKNWATASVYAPKTAMGDNGKGKADKCISYKAHGANWKSAYFIYDNMWHRADMADQLKKQKEEEKKKLVGLKWGGH